MPQDRGEFTFTRAQAVICAHRLRRGLDLVAVSLLLIPVTPCVLMLSAAVGTGDPRMLRLGLLVMLEHGLWLVGVRVATEFAITHPPTRGPSRRARQATTVDALAAMLFLLSMSLALRFETLYFEAALYVCLGVALVSRGVALWAATSAVAAVLRALGLTRVALSLRVLAALACGLVAVSLAGVAMILYTAGGDVAGPRAATLRETGFFLLVTGLPALGVVALLAGGACTFGALRLQRQFGRVAAALRGAHAGARCTRR